MRPGRSEPRHSLLAVLLVAGSLTGCAATVEAESLPTPTAAAAATIAGASTSPMPPSAAQAPDASTSVPGARAASPAATSRPASPYALNLYRRGDFVAQYTFDWCVGASVQMTLNMVRPRDDRSRRAQQRLWERARDLSSSPFGGANPRGWTAVLNESGIGRYELISVPDLTTAVRTAALAIRTTKRPVGLVMWRGRHAWVMSGFTSLGDPARTDDFVVTGVRVLDPLHPHGSTLWGPSPRPNSLLTPPQLARQYVPRLRGRVDLGVPPGYLLIVPLPG